MTLLLPRVRGTEPGISQQALGDHRRLDGPIFSTEDSANKESAGEVPLLGGIHNCDYPSWKRATTCGIVSIRP